MTATADTLFVGTTTGHLAAVGRVGTRRWQTRETSAATTTTPVHDDTRGHLYVGYADGVRAFDAASGDHQWTVRTANRVAAAPVVGDDVVLVADRSTVVALDPETGTRRWGVEVANPIVSLERRDPSRLIVADRNGIIAALDANTRSIRWENRLEWYTRAPPVTATGSVFVDTADTYLYALDAATGEKQWVRHPGPGGLSPVSVDGGRVVAGTADGTAAAFSAADGTTQWSFDVDASLPGKPVVANGRVFLAALDGDIHVVDVTSGRQQTTLTTDGALRTAPVVDDAIYTVTRDGTLTRRPLPERD